MSLVGEPPSLSNLIERIGLGAGQVWPFLLSGAVVYFVDGGIMSQVHLSVRPLQDEFKMTGFQKASLAACADFGQILGSCSSGYLGGTLGRRPMVLLSLAGAAIGCFASASASSVNILYGFRILIGTSIGMGLTPASVYVSELCPERWRILAQGGLMCFCVAGALCFEQLVALRSADLVDMHWRNLLTETGLLACVFLLFSWRFLKESPIFLACSGRHLAAKEGFATMAALNGLGGMDSNYVVPQGSVESCTLTARQQLAVVFGPRYLTVTISCLLVMFCMHLLKFGDKYACAQMFVEESSLPAVYQYMVKTASTLPGILLAVIFAHRLPRRFAVSSGLLFGVSSCMAFVVGCTRSPPRPLVYESLFQLGSNSMGFSLSVVQVTLQQLAIEVYPPTASACGLGLCWASGRVGAVLGPFAVEWIWRKSGDSHAFYLFMAVLFLAHAVLIQLAPELEPYRLGESPGTMAEPKYGTAAQRRIGDKC